MTPELFHDAEKPNRESGEPGRVQSFVFRVALFFCHAVLSGLLLFGSSAKSAEILGTNALIFYTDDIHFSSYINYQPGNGATVDINPPIFSWLYQTNWTGANIETNMFTFQASYSTDFSSPVIHVTTSLPYYNFFDHFDTNISRTIYWRVGYTPASALTTTNWSTGTRSFTIAHGAPYWDRGMYADDTWMNTNGAAHPKLWVRPGTGTTVSNWFATNTSATFPNGPAVLNTISNSTLNTYIISDAWTNPTPANLTTNNAALFVDNYKKAAEAG